MIIPVTLFLEHRTVHEFSIANARYGDHETMAKRRLRQQSEQSKDHVMNMYMLIRPKAEMKIKQLQYREEKYKVKNNKRVPLHMCLLTIWDGGVVKLPLRHWQITISGRRRPT